ncbi:MAG: diaminopimelate epimerase [Bacteroides sp.]|nr:diaminopimelate epimerase [Bacteroides sp.]
MSELKRLYFTKMHGAGNDYVYIDTFNTPTSNEVRSEDLPIISRKISDRHFGVGGDGLIAILPSANADFRMRMFNADGSEAQMCGNGSRCVAKYVYDKGLTDKTTITLETLAGIKVLKLHIEDGEVKSVTVDMGPAYHKRGEIPAAGDPESEMIDEAVKIDDRVLEITGIGMGNPHGVIFTDEITDKDIHHYGRMLEAADIWPEKANIEFVKVVSADTLEMRVWERGSGETLACGTGACASLVAAFKKGLTGTEADLRLLGGTLHIRYDEANGHVYMTGPAETVAEGVYFYKMDD